jgi:sulfatase modifying factor 1
MKKFIKSIYYSSCALIILILLLGSCKMFKKTESSVTGWNYNDTSVGKFEKENYKAQKLPKKAARYFNDMVLIEGGSFTMGKNTGLTPNINDTNMLFSLLQPVRAIVPSFYLSDHEVTNAEYREFVNWVRDSIALTLLAQKDPSYYRDKEKKHIDWQKRSLLTEAVYSSLEMYYPKGERFNDKKEFDTRKFIYTYSEVYDSTSGPQTISIPVYPDTLCWMNDFPYSYNEPLVKSYFWHAAFDNYPVVGVSWQQANAYCKWRTDRLNEEIAKHKGTLFPAFRLPTEAEWEYAAYGLYNSEDKYEYSLNIYPWTGISLTDQKGLYYANFGPVRDQNNIMVKNYDEDLKVSKTNHLNYSTTSPVKHFPANGFKLYDMAGNVAEWVMDMPVCENIVPYVDLYGRMMIESPYKIYPGDNLESTMKKIKNRWIYLDSIENRNSNKEYKESFILYQAQLEMHDVAVLQKIINPRIAKGGSWADGPVALLCSGKMVYNENKSCSRIGFRVAMTLVVGPVTQ